MTDLPERSHIYQCHHSGGGSFWRGGASTFLHKGKNGRWREVLSDEELGLYAAACDRALTPECRAWLENGGRA